MKLIVFAPKTNESKRKTCHARKSQNKPPSGRRYITKLKSGLLNVCVLTVSAQKLHTKEEYMAISDVQLKGSWYTVFDDNGKKIKDIQANYVGELCGFGSDFIVFVKGSFYSTYNESGNKIKDMQVNYVGNFRNASGSTIVFKNGSFIGTYDKDFKKLSERQG
jgi:hypothetical protein